LSNLRNLRVTQGGSTITQQLVKNYFLSHDRTIERKVKEALIALLIENFASKDDILETYLNIIYMGQAGAFEVRGFGAASHYYFNRPLEQLDLPECAFLAAVINSPGKFHPIRYPERARARRDLVLRKLQELGKISERQRQAASAAALPVKLSFDSPETLPFVFDAVLAERLQESERSRDKAKKNSKAFGEKILMTIDRRKQELAQVSVNQGLAELRALRDQISTKFERSAKSIKKEDKVSRGQEKPDSLQAALISVEVSSGRVVALVGGTDWRLAPFNRALRANRQIGSLVKPWIAYLGFLLDQELTANSIWRDEPVQVPVPGGQWEPKNYDGNVRGPVRFREAFSQSLNLPFVHYGLSLGLPKVRRALSEVMGVEVPSLPSVLLGSFEATPMILTEAFYRLVASVEQPVNIDLARDLGSQGARTAGPLKIFPLRHIEASIQGEQLSQGTSRFTSEPAYTSALDDRASTLTLELMEETCLSGTGRAVQKVFVGERVACKTGTTSDLRDSWFVGYARGYLTLVWVGTDTPQNTGLTGASGALPIWLRYQKSL
jgi:membrane peptidoglycan carboxypeptidase